MHMIDTINSFVDTMLDSEAKFKANKAKVEAYDRQLEEIISEFNDNMLAITGSSKIDTDDEDAQGLYDNTLEELRKMLARVVDKMDSTKKGMAFINEYEQSFNVAVFGKVKAGKSFLGNFVMGNEIRDMGISTSYDRIERPLVEVYDRGKKSLSGKLAEISEEGNEGFRVDPNEATSAIQLFRLGGLTWFDTPGIGSITWENEMLAKDYVDNADLVVYLTNSDAPGTRQDFAELKALSEKGKQFLLLITRSDAYEEDTDEEGEIISVLVPKTDEEREESELYMCNELRANGINVERGKSILSISTKLAFEGLKSNDEELFAGSNISEFLKILTSITCNEGAELKLKTPGVRINSACIQIDEILSEVDETLKKYKVALECKKVDMVDKKDLLLENLKLKCMNAIDRVIHQKSQEIEDGKKQLSGEELTKILSDEVFGVISRECLGEFASSGEILNSHESQIKLEGVGDLKMRTDKIEYTRQKVIRVPREPEGIFEKIGGFFGKEYFSNEMTTVNAHTTVQLGVNEQQIRTIAKDQLDVLFETSIPEIVSKISLHIIDPIFQIQESASSVIADTRTRLEKLRC